MSTRLIILLVMIAQLIPVIGCVRRRLTLRSEPPGAVVFLDKREIGKTPISTNFNYYGKREVKFVKDGYETHTEIIDIRAPWYEWPGIDFVSEVLVPGEITDKRNWDVKLRPQTVVSPDDLVAQAERLKAVAHSSGTLRIDAVGTDNLQSLQPTESLQSGTSTATADFGPPDPVVSTPAPPARTSEFPIPSSPFRTGDQ
ncbi:MAG: PEGA domain-containing protein [Thermoguttaceae bacterium]